MSGSRSGSRSGRFVVLDGIDGCGKTTQAKRLVAALAEQGAEPLHLREPGSTAAGERIRELLLDSDLDLGAAPEALLFAAARRQMLDELVRPALERGRAVVCERFHASTFAYQAVAGELDEGLLLTLLHAWAGDPRPDLVVILAVDPVQAWARSCGADGERDRIESRGEVYQTRVAAGFQRYAELATERVTIVDGMGSEDEVFERIRKEVLGAGR